MESCISMGSEAKCSITVSVTCVYTVTVDSVFLLQDPLLGKLAEHEGTAPEKIAKFCDALNGHGKSRVWGLMKTKVTVEGGETLQVWNAACNGAAVQKNKNSCLRARVGDPTLSKRFLKETHEIKMSDTYKRKVKPFSYWEMCQKFGKTDASLKIQYQDIIIEIMSGQKYTNDASISQ